MASKEQAAVVEGSRDSKMAASTAVVTDAKNAGAIASGVGRVEEVNGDVLEAKEQYLFHQTNVVSWQGRGLSAALFDRFPHANIYKLRCVPGKREGRRDTPGLIIVCGDGSPEWRFVVNAMAQLWPGKPRYWGNDDTSAKRIAWFRACLEQTAALPGIKSIALPHNIGCGLAGGHWPTYLAAIHACAAANPQLLIRIYRLTTPT
jgi:O-acetyl-ADP-ribose deacetylase (regulator of RNase III)